MNNIKLLLRCYYVSILSLNFVASQLASLILGDERNQVTYTTSYLPTSAFIEWIRNGNQFSTAQCEAMTVVSVTDGLFVSNSSLDYLYRDKKLASLCAYVFFTFHVKVSAHTFLRSENCHLPRFDLELPHPQYATHCFMRLKQPRVPIPNGCATRIPQCWTERSFDLQLHSDE